VGGTCDILRNETMGSEIRPRRKKGKSWVGPFQFQTKKGRNITICLFSDEVLEGLLTFYDEFEPREGYQGLPPRLKPRRRGWVENLVQGNLTLLAMDEDRIIAHAAAIPIPSSTMAELLVFVHQDFQNQGIGTELIRLVAEYAGDQGFKRLWLTVLTANAIAVHVFKKCGFRFVGPMDSEREMILDLGLTRVA
jgi:RimJ/RimL family protein N-acetyltransferase